MAQSPTTATTATTARRTTAGVLTALAVTAAAAACGTTSPDAGPAHHGLRVVASIGAWGSLAAQLGGDRVEEVSLVRNPDTDPHSYEPSPADARAVAAADVVVENGIGYDGWMDRLLAADPNPRRVVVDVGNLTHLTPGANPHQWYAPATVDTVIDAITDAYRRADAADASYFADRHAHVRTDALGEYHRLIDTIKSRYAGTPIGASESIVTPLADALGLRLLTPPSFLKAVSEGTDPAPADKADIDRQIAEKAITVYLYNSQNSIPDVQAQVDAAKRAGIPVVTVTETPTPADASFQSWQTAQLKAVASALHQATGK